ncbi:MAG: helix-turn-helix transcriptional regulator [Chitinophagaceae bacterium]
MMRGNRNNEHFPILGIQEFGAGAIGRKSNLLFHELHGERHIDEPHKHDFFIILLFEKGSGVHSIDFVDYRIACRQIHLLFPGQVHAWDIKPATRGYQLMADRDLFEAVSPDFRFPVSFYQKHPVQKLNAKSFQEFLYEFAAISKELKEQNPLPQLLRSRLQVITSLISKEGEKIYHDDKKNHSNALVSGYQQLIEQYYKQQRSVAFYADKLHITPNYLNILCQKNMQQQATHLIQERIVLEAKRLLRVSDLSVKEIAADLGFDDHAYFSNFFKAQTGTTPSNFRTQY